VCQIFPEISGLFKHPKHPYSYGLGWYHIATLGTRQAHGIWDVTVPDTYAESHIDQTAREACSAANKAAANKTVKYGALSASHIFLPVAVETAGTWNQSAIELIQELVDALLQSHKRNSVPVTSALILLFKGGMRARSPNPGYRLHSTPCDIPSWSLFLLSLIFTPAALCWSAKNNN